MQDIKIHTKCVYPAYCVSLYVWYAHTEWNEKFVACHFDVYTQMYLLRFLSRGEKSVFVTETEREREGGFV